MSDRTLKEFSRLPPEEQRLHRKEILELFEQFLLSDSSEEQWREQLAGLVLMPEMLHKLFRGTKQ